MLYFFQSGESNMSDLIVENIHETRNYGLLEEVYHDLLKPCFPDPDDHLSWKKMKYMSKNGIENEKENGRVLISISKKRNEEGIYEPISFVVAVYYRKSQTGLISYMGMKGGCKGVKSLSMHEKMHDSLKLEAKKNKGQLKSVFSIVDLPEHANPKYITIDPVNRLVLMERMGASHIPIDFHYPLFDTGIFSLFRKKISYKNDAALLGYKLNGKIAMQSPEVIKDFLDDLYASYGIDSSKDKIVEQMKIEVDKIEVGKNVKLSKAYRKHPKEKGHIPVNNLPSSHTPSPVMHRKMMQR